MAAGAQAGFDGFGPPVPTDRLFFALFPDGGTASRIAALAASECARHGLHGKPLRSDRLHMTLFHLGDWAAYPKTWSPPPRARQAHCANRPSNSP